MASAETQTVIGGREAALIWIRRNQGEVVYVAGPMNGQPDHGYPVFERAAKRLWAKGVVPLSPHYGGPSLDTIEVERLYADVQDFRDTRLYYTMVRRDIGHVLMSRAVFMLPNWAESRGATVEMSVALITGCAVFDGAWLLTDSG